MLFRSDENEVVMISKDTAWIDDDGKIVRQTITRPLTGFVPESRASGEMEASAELS